MIAQRDPAVLLISYPFPPIFQAGAFRTLRFVRFLPKFQWQPIVLTISRKSAQPEMVMDETLEQLVPDQIRVYRAPILRGYAAAARVAKAFINRRTAPGDIAHSDPQPENSGRNGCKRQPTTLRNCAEWTRNLLFETPDTEVGWVLPAVVQALRIIRRHPVDALYTTGPPHSAHLIGLALKMITHLPWVMDLRDPWARAPWHAERYKGVQGRISARLERHCVRHADRVLLNTPRLRDDFCSYYQRLPAARFRAVPNGYDPELAQQIQPLLDSAKPRNGRVRLCHAGSIYRQRNLQPLLLALKTMLEQGYHVSFEQVGNVDNSAELQRFVNTQGLSDYITFTPHLPHREALARMASADVLVVVQPGTALQVPSKLYEMLLFRKPLLALADPGATADLVQQFELGVVAAPDRPEAIAAALKEALTDRCSPSDGWQRAVAAFDGYQLTREFAEVLTELLPR